MDKNKTRILVGVLQVLVAGYESSLIADHPEHRTVYLLFAVSLVIIGFTFIMSGVKNLRGEKT